MTDEERIEALLDLVDPDRTPVAEAGDRLIVLGLARRAGRSVAPTTAGWNLMGDRGRAFDR